MKIPVYYAAAFLMAFGLTAFAQKSPVYIGGVVDDWTHHHVIFSNPGTLEDALNKDTYENWHRIVTDPRYRMQWIKRYGAPSDELTGDFSRLPDPPNPLPPLRRWRPRWIDSSLQGAWSQSIAPGGSGTAIDMYPAKYTFAPIATPSCASDFVVFPVNTNGSSSVSNIVGLNNLYSSCSGTVPSFLFAYFVGTGVVQTSPVLSEDGTKVAFVESVTGGSKFHVLTIGTTGNNGTYWSPPVTPCTVNGVTSCSTNNAVDNSTVMKGSVSVTRSSPFVDYQNDNAYVGDDSGNLHKFHPVFTGTPAEVTAGGWPLTVASGMILTGPVYDSGASGNIFVGGSNGNLYCVVASTAKACSTASISVASGTNPVLDAPIVDSTNQTVFAAASNSTTSYLTQATTSLGSVVRVNMGASGTDLYDGAFDSAYFTSVSTGHMYLCGNLTTAATPTLWRVTFNSSGTMSSANDGSSFQLVVSGFTGTGYDCTPLTEIYNGTTDYLFVSVKGEGFGTGTPNCSYSPCVMNFIITSSFPTSANATRNSSSSSGISGMIIDNASTAIGGASQIYFSNPSAGAGVQLSQSGLQ
jgi:hypothetical protein